MKMDSEEEHTFRNTSMPQQCFNFFADLRNQKKFCDIEFVAGNQSISAHRVIVTAAIPLFRETLFEEEEIPVPDIDNSVFECLIDYSYSCELKITMVNVKALLAGACMLHMKDVLDACCDFLHQRLNAENVLNFRDLAVDLNITQLQEITDLYIKENFEEVSKTEEFLHSPLTYVRDLIGKDDLNVVSEEKVLESVLRWVKSSFNRRKDNLIELLKQVRMVLLKPLYLKNLLEREEIIRTSIPARDLVDEANYYNLIPESRKAVCSFSTECRRFMNICEETEETRCAIYSFHGILKYNVLQLCFEGETWINKYNQEYYLNTGCVAALNEKIYFFHRSYTLEYERINDKFNLLQPSAVPKKQAAAASLRRKIFVCGGFVGSHVASNAVECFDPGENKWAKRNPLLKARWSLNTVSLGDYIYALGGRDNEKVYGTVERYNLNIDKWRYMSSMLTPRRSSGAAVLNGRIYVCGGSTSCEYKGTPATEIYDPLINKWTVISPMNTVRCALSLVAFCGKLYAIAGEDSGEKIQNSSEIYDPETCKWIDGPSLPLSHRNSGAVVM